MTSLFNSLYDQVTLHPRAQRIAAKQVEGADVEFWQFGLATFVFRRVPGGAWALVKEIAS
jgi:hypothetical protein